MDNNKRYETVTVPQDLKDRIFSVVDSKYTRDFLAEDDDFNIYNWVDLIGSSPRPMDLKLELLRELIDVPMEREAQTYLQGCLDEASSSMDRLYHMDSERSVLLTYYMHSEYVDAFANYAEPCGSYEDFLDRAREDIWEDDEPLEEQSDYQEHYYKLDLYDVAEGKFREQITYFCVPNGKVQYYHKSRRLVKLSEANYEQERMEDAFAGKVGLKLWTTPYRVGDILYVDMRPYFKPTYCLIIWVSEQMPYDCCGVQCLYLAAGGLVGETALKHGRFLPHLLADPNSRTRQFYSPMFRAELFGGELPEEYAFLKAVSDRIKEEPGLSEKIDEYFEKDHTVESVRFVYRPVPVTDPNWEEEDQEGDAAWHPERKEREWWEDYEVVNGVTKARLLALAGCNEPGADHGLEKNREEQGG